MQHQSPAQTRAQTLQTPQAAFTRALALERPRLVRLCAYLTGAPSAAEDLAQETLLEAWRHADHLTDPAGVARWLSAIARYVCLRWRRAQGTGAPLVVSLDASEDGVGLDLADPSAEGDAMTRELERGDLARLLERALATVPVETRQVLVARYIEELPQAEAATRLGLSEGALAVRLHRGKRALRRVLEGTLRDEAMDAGLPVAAADGWQETHMWCLACGQRHLWGCFDAAASELILRCPGCHADRGLVTCHHVSYQRLFADVHGHRAAFNRVLRWAGVYYRNALREGSAICQHCWRLAPVRMGYPAAKLVAPSEGRGFHVACAACGYPQNDSSLAFLILALPEGQRFWREHPRLRPLAEREVEAQGCAAVVAGYESVTDGARLEVVSACATLEVLSIHAG